MIKYTSSHAKQTHTRYAASSQILAEFFGISAAASAVAVSVRVTGVVVERVVVVGVAVVGPAQLVLERADAGRDASHPQPVHVCNKQQRRVRLEMSAAPENEVRECVVVVG